MTGVAEATELGLVARTVELERDEPVDLLAFAGADGFLFEHEGVGVAARGVALRLPLPDGLDQAAARAVVAALRSLAGDGGRPIALGAFPFDSTRPAEAFVPEAVVRRDGDGRQWLTTVGRTEDATPPSVELAPATDDEPELPDSFTLTSPRPHREWTGTIADAVDAIDAGRLEKVVVAREVRVDANRAIVVPDVLERLRALYPSCHVFSIDGFVGASPELLVERHGRSVRSHPLAGTYPRSGDPHADDLLAAELLASGKDRREHGFVVDEICRALGAAGAELDVPDGPSILQLRNVLHLGTEIGARFGDDTPSALELAALLHPTPAVGGTPRAEALRWLDAHEQLERGRYAGPVGWVDADGDGVFAVGIRSAEVDGPTARLFAGVGIVAGSDPRRELIETQLKLQALLAAIVRP